MHACTLEASRKQQQQKKHASHVHIEYSVVITISGQNGQLADIKPMQRVTTRPHADMQYDGRGLENMHT